jgi:hypothetical protein
MRCYHCGREVGGTLHTQKSYRVDYYRLHTGHSDWDAIVDLKTDTSPVRYLKLTDPTNILTRVDCYDRPDFHLVDNDFAGGHPQ